MKREEFRTVYEGGFEATFALVEGLSHKIDTLTARIQKLQNRLAKDSHNSPQATLQQFSCQTQPEESKKKERQVGGVDEGLLSEIEEAVRKEVAREDRHLTPERLEGFERRYQEPLEAGLEANPSPERTGKKGRPKQSKGKNLVERLDKHREAVRTTLGCHSTTTKLSGTCGWSK